MPQATVYEEIVKLGPSRLCEWLNRPKASELPFAAPLAERAAMLLYPALAGAYHDNFRSLSALRHFLNYAFIQDIVEGDYPEHIKKNATSVIEFIDAFSTPSQGEFDPHTHYQDAAFLPMLRLKALDKVPSEMAAQISDCSLDFTPFIQQVRASETVSPPTFPILIWAGNVQKMNNILHSTENTDREAAGLNPANIA